MWKSQLRSKGKTAQMDLDIKPTPKKKRRDCIQEYHNFHLALVEKYKLMKSHAPRLGVNPDNWEFSHDANELINLFGGQSHYDVPDEYYCLLMETIKTMDEPNYTNNGFSKKGKEFTYDGVEYRVHIHSYNHNPSYDYPKQNILVVTVRHPNRVNYLVRWLLKYTIYNKDEIELGVNANWKWW
jgi:hypothetical protein